ncbi:carboxypeptidase regulatory-like domain-containing protein [Roseiconus nitratireducens]|uniref:Carboxypeptidase regulatory-like domain-containing protein n=1 Tax=Roseiconus nitratireducens TaxID=2605748 RepID=A0A5M6D0F2_9BACT|nr:carboxypeptidase-like regulatory domain-containing protein [Roseiconus nitratireducens]KAA5540924.1 carboxypeptidase regulatory-like domain-containing protein [Roseiconus nitratireducens]
MMLFPPKNVLASLIAQARWFTAVAVMVGSSITVSAQTGTNREIADNAKTKQSHDATLIEALESRLEKLESGQREIREGIARLESKLEGYSSDTTGQSLVTIRIRSQSGKPLSGFEVTLKSDFNDGPLAQATGTSDGSGVAIRRSMPYGTYDIQLRSNGWAAYIADRVLEVGQAKEWNITAPDPDQFSDMVLQSKLRAEAFSELPFGVIRESRGGGAWSEEYTPEPDAEESSQSYPRLGHGISEIASTLNVEATRTFEQTDGSELEWDWRFDRSGQSSSKRLWFTAEGVALLEQFEVDTVDFGEQSEFFSDLQRDESVELYIVDQIDDVKQPRTIRVPTGKVQIQVDKIFGRVDEPLRRAIKEHATGSGKSHEGQRWLTANLQSESGWIDRVFSRSGWEPAKNAFLILSRDETVSAGETCRVVLASP